MEEGEVYETDHYSATVAYANEAAADASGNVYSPALEWPHETESELTPPASLTAHSDDAAPTLGSHSHSSPSLRLLVQRSSVLPKKHSIAVIDGYEEVQLGRDAAHSSSDVPRIRLKEMEVSKIHATIYWDQDRREWAVVDMGSKHGTFFQAGLSSGAFGDSVVVLPSPQAAAPLADDPRGWRLSSPRMASIPRRLNHLDRLSLGSTTFIVHIHDDQIPCVECSPTGDDEIPLCDTRSSQREASRKRKRDLTLSSETAPTKQDPKRALATLKRSLLTRHAPYQVVQTSTQYVDRSAQRRALRSDSIPVTPPTSSSPSSTRVTGYPAVMPTASPSPTLSSTSTPLPDTNVGHRLLMKQGWQPGTRLGQTDSSGTALIEPLSVSGNAGRAGLGLTSSTSGDTDVNGLMWRDQGKLRRWANERPK